MVINCYVIIALLLPILNFFAKYSKVFYRIHQYFHEMLFWNGILIIFLEGGIELILCAMINIWEVLHYGKQLVVF